MYLLFVMNYLTTIYQQQFGWYEDGRRGYSLFVVWQLLSIIPNPLSNFRQYILGVFGLFVVDIVENFAY